MKKTFATLLLAVITLPLLFGPPPPANVAAYDGTRTSSTSLVPDDIVANDQTIGDAEFLIEGQTYTVALIGDYTGYGTVVTGGPIATMAIGDTFLATDHLLALTIAQSVELAYVPDRLANPTLNEFYTANPVPYWAITGHVPISPWTRNADPENTLFPTVVCGKNSYVSLDRAPDVALICGGGPTLTTQSVAIGDGNYVELTNNNFADITSLVPPSTCKADTIGSVVQLHLVDDGSPTSSKITASALILTPNCFDIFLDDGDTVEFTQVGVCGANAVFRMSDFTSGAIIGADGNGIYTSPSGSGALVGNITVTGGCNSLDFCSVSCFIVSSSGCLALNTTGCVQLTAGCSVSIGSNCGSGVTIFACSGGSAKLTANVCNVELEATTACGGENKLTLTSCGSMKFENNVVGCCGGFDFCSTTGSFDVTTPTANIGTCATSVFIEGAAYPPCGDGNGIYTSPSGSGSLAANALVCGAGFDFTISTTGDIKHTTCSSAGGSAINSMQAQCGGNILIKATDRCGVGGLITLESHGPTHLKTLRNQNCGCSGASLTLETENTFHCCSSTSADIFIIGGGSAANNGCGATTSNAGSIFLTAGTASSNSPCGTLNHGTVTINGFGCDNVFIEGAAYPPAVPAGAGGIYGGSGNICVNTTATVTNCLTFNGCGVDMAFHPTCGNFVVTSVCGSIVLTDGSGDGIKITSANFTTEPCSPNNWSTQGGVCGQPITIAAGACQTLTLSGDGGNDTFVLGCSIVGNSDVITFAFSGCGNVGTHTFGDANDIVNLLGTVNVNGSPPLTSLTPANNFSTGLLSGGLVQLPSACQTACTGALYNVDAGEGVIINNCVQPPTSTNISWLAQVDLPVCSNPADIINFVGVEDNGFGVAQFVEQNTPFTPAQRRETIVLGVAVSLDGEFVSVINQEQHVAFAPVEQVHDLAHAIGFINASGNVFSQNPTHTTSDMTLAKTVGDVFAIGSNYPSVKNPNQKTLSAYLGNTAPDIQYRYEDGSNAPTDIDIDPDFWDDLGGLGGYANRTAVMAGKVTIQRVYLFLSNSVKIQPSQTAPYNNMTTALNALQLEQTTFMPEPSMASNGIFRGWLAIEGGVTDLDAAVLAGEAVFIAAGKFGADGGGGGGGGAGGGASGALTLDHDEFSATTTSHGANTWELASINNTTYVPAVAGNYIVHWSYDLRNNMNAEAAGLVSVDIANDGYGVGDEIGYGYSDHGNDNATENWNAKSGHRKLVLLNATTPYKFELKSPNAVNNAQIRNLQITFTYISP